MPDQFLSIREALEHWNAQVQKNEHNGHWIVPVTQDVLDRVQWLDWPNMLKVEGLKDGSRAMHSVVPMFYTNEADANKFDKPRLDFVVTFDNGEAVRYHPSADRMWLPVSNAVSAIAKRTQRLANLRRKYGRDWER